MTESDTPIGEDELQAYVDDRLGGLRLAAVQAYLAAHAEVAVRVAADRQVRANLRRQLDAKFTEPIPGRLRLANLRHRRRALRSARLRTAAAAAVLFVVGAGGGWLAGRSHPSGEPTRSAAAAVPVTADALAAYRTFVVEVAHPVEVNAANESHLVQWLSRRLGRSLSVPDLSSYGYTLMGGRLLPAGSTAAAQLMYDDASGKRLTVYVQASSGTQTAFRFQKDGDASTFSWIDGGFGFAVTGAAGREILLPIAEAVYRRFEGDTDKPRKG